jgi:hypothetical protein
MPKIMKTVAVAAPVLTAVFAVLYQFFPFGDFRVFFFTSLGGALFDGFFVIMQRFNRPRVVKMAEREKRNRKA